MVVVDVLVDVLLVDPRRCLGCFAIEDNRPNYTHSRQKYLRPTNIISMFPFLGMIAMLLASLTGSPMARVDESQMPCLKVTLLCNP